MAACARPCQNSTMGIRYNASRNDNNRGNIFHVYHRRMLCNEMSVIYLEKDAPLKN